MGILYSFFHKNSDSRILTKEEKTIIDCKICRDKIKYYIKTLEKKEHSKRAQAKQLLKDNKREKAKLLLNQSKIFSEQIKTASAELDMLINQIYQLESAVMKKGVFQVLEKGNLILKKLNDDFNIEKWEEISEDIQEMKQEQNKISQFLLNHKIDENKFNEQINIELEEIIKLQNQGKSEKTTNQPEELAIKSNTQNVPLIVEKTHLIKNKTLNE